MTRTSADPAPPSATSRLGTARHWVGNLALLLLLVALWPASAGGPLGYVVVTGNSMLPTYTSGDLVVTRASSQVHIGDVAVFTVPPDEPGAGMSVIHRIASGTAEHGWRTHGDNNPAADPWVIHPADIDGVVRAHVPFVGHVLLALRTWWALALIAVAASGYFLVRALTTRVHAHEPPDDTSDGSVRQPPPGDGSQAATATSSTGASSTGGSFSMNASASSNDIDAR